MPKIIQPQDITLADLKERFSLQKSTDESFFDECLEYLPELTDLEKQYLERVKTNYISLVENSPLLEEAVKLVILSPLLDLAGFYRSPFQIATEEPIEISEEIAITDGEENNGIQKEIIKGRIDVLVLYKQFWLLVIESKITNFSLQKAIPQALTYMLSSPNLIQNPQKNIYGFVTNGEDFQFLKLVIIDNKPVYALSERLTLYKRENELYNVLILLKKLGQMIIL
ncbi:MAG: restriction endonuclease subunit R [Richelia sp. RM2_1_2]|nr:restriction endonuclease subunit R [Richelia sp. SM1_7_0]NJN08735.1 restriction endonuclease subunit R [Richelia sp. RM1_1_1]NJO27660.1 restriction endonuclease subunit R [Richelia sp. SL_2_1]NJO59264.1 restriction endonuclease subunit R [Richelia sp. RM2_1_2]